MPPSRATLIDPHHGTIELSRSSWTDGLISIANVSQSVGTAFGDRSASSDGLFRHRVAVDDLSLIVGSAVLIARMIIGLVASVFSRRERDIGHTTRVTGPSRFRVE